MRHKEKTLVLCGMTGHGKSSTGNFILGRDLFLVSDQTLSGTLAVSRGNCPNYIVYDTVGFGDTSTSQEKVKMMLAESIVRQDNKQGNIDAFLLVFAFARRMTQLKECLETMVNLFGPYVLQSTVMLLIDRQRKSELDGVLCKINEHLQEVREIICESRREETVNKSWIMMWDNHQPFKGQVQQLSTLVWQARPYDHTEYREHVKNQQVRLLADTDIKTKILIEARRLKEEVAFEKSQENTYLHRQQTEGEESAIAFAEEQIRILKKTITNQIFQREKTLTTLKRNYQIAVAATGLHQGDRSAEISLLKRNLDNNLLHIQEQANSAIAQNQMKIESIKHEISTKQILQPGEDICIHCRSRIGHLFISVPNSKSFLHVSCIQPYYASLRKVCNQCGFEIRCFGNAIQTRGALVHKRCISNPEVHETHYECIQRHPLFLARMDKQKCNQCGMKENSGHTVVVCPECMLIKCATNYLCELLTIM